MCTYSFVEATLSHRRWKGREGLPGGEVDADDQQRKITTTGGRRTELRGFHVSARWETEGLTPLLG